MKKKKFISKKLQNRFRFEKYLDILKAKIRDENESKESKETCYILTFLLSFILLEAKLKTILFWKDGPKKYKKNQKKFKNFTFGELINEFTNFILEAGSKVRVEYDYRRKKIFECETLCCFFIKYCKQVNKIRNELIHNIATSYSGSKNLIGIDDILFELKSEFVGKNDRSFYKNELMSSLCPEKTIKEIIDKNKDLKKAKLDILLIIADEILNHLILKKSKVQLC